LGALPTFKIFAFCWVFLKTCKTAIKWSAAKMSERGSTWYKRDPIRFMDGVEGMGPELIGAYAYVLDLIYSRNGYSKRDDGALAGRMGCSKRKAKALVDSLIERGKIDAEGDYLTQKHAKKHANTTRTLHEQRVSAGRAGGEKSAKSRKNKHLSEASASSKTNQIRIDKNTDTNVSGADAPPSPDKVMFDSGKRLLVEAGKTQAQAGQLLGKWRKAHGTEAVIAALGRAQREAAIDPVSFIEGCFKFHKRKSQPQVGDVRVTPSGERQEFIGGTDGWVRVHE